MWHGVKKRPSSSSRAKHPEPMKLFLSDHTLSSQGKTRWQNALEKVFGAQFQSGATNEWTQPKSRHPAYRDATAILFCHSDGGEPRWKRKADSVKCHLILVRSVYRYPPESNRKGNLHGCWWIPDDFVMPSRPPRLQQWIEQVQAADVQQVDWTLLQPAGAECVSEPVSVEVRRQSVKAFATAVFHDVNDEEWLRMAHEVRCAFKDRFLDLDSFFVSGKHHESGDEFRTLLRRALSINLTQEIRTDCKHLLQKALKGEFLLDENTYRGRRGSDR